MKKMIALLLALCMMFALAACSQAKDRDLHETPTVAEEPQDVESEQDSENSSESAEAVKEDLPTATSKDVELYTIAEANGLSYVVNKFGEPAEKYSLNDNGDILDKDGKVVVVAKNTEEFHPISFLSFEKNDYAVILDAREESVDGDYNVTRVNQYAVNYSVTLNYRPKDATNQVILIQSTNTDAVEIRANSNAKILADGEFETERNQIAIEPQDPEKPLKITLTAKQAGETKLIAESLVGDTRAECVVTVTQGMVDSIPVPTDPPTQYVNVSGDDMRHVHNYRATVVDPTIYEKGYTLYVCDECGYSYKDNYTSKLPAPDPVEDNSQHVHSYRASVVAPTETERGYTLYICDECGDSYKDNFVNPTGK